MQNKVTLRKAAQIVSEIEKWVVNNKPTVATTKVVTKNTDVPSLVQEGRTKFVEVLDKQQKLYKILATIKNHIGLTNSTVGITSLLGDLSVVEKQLAMLNTLDVKKWDRSLTEMVDEAEQINNHTDMYSRNISVSFINTEIVEGIENQIYNLKKEKTQLTDKLSEYNSSNHILISENNWQFLESLRIVQLVWEKLGRDLLSFMDKRRSL